MSQAWEQFLAQKFPTLKRYSGEGAESVLALTLALIEDSSKFNISQVSIQIACLGEKPLR